MKKNTYFFDENNDLILVPHNPEDKRLQQFLEKWRRKVRDQVAQEIDSLLCDNGAECYGVNQEHCDIIRQCAALARETS